MVDFMVIETKVEFEQNGGRYDDMTRSKSGLGTVLLASVGRRTRMNTKIR